MCIPYTNCDFLSLELIIMFRILIVVAILLSLPIGSASIGISPQCGSTEGGTRVTIGLSREVQDIKCYDVALTNNLQCYDLELSNSQCEDGYAIIAITRPMRPDIYFLRLTYHTNMPGCSQGPLSETDYCSSENRCRFLVKSGCTPTITYIASMCTGAGSLAQFKGKVITELTVNDMAARMTDIAIHNAQLSCGSSVMACELYNTPEYNHVGVKRTDDPEAGYGEVKCRLSPAEVGCCNIRYQVTGPYGRSKADGCLKWVNRDGDTCMIEVYPVVESITPRELNPDGGKYITITGKGFIPRATEVLMGNRGRCKIISITKTVIICKSPPESEIPAPDITGIHCGHYHVLLEAWANNGITDFSQLSVPGQTDKLYFTDTSWMIYKSLGYASINTRMKACLWPPASGNYQMTLKANTKARLTMDTTGDNPASQTQLILCTNTNCDSVSSTYNLLDNKRYCFELTSIDSMRSSWAELGMNRLDTYHPTDDGTCATNLQQSVCITHTDTNYRVEKQTITRSDDQFRAGKKDKQWIKLTTTDKNTLYNIEFQPLGGRASAFTTGDIMVGDNAETVYQKVDTALRNHLGQRMPYPLVEVKKRDAAPDAFVTFFFNSILGNVNLVTIQAPTSVTVDTSKLRDGRRSKNNYYFQLGANAISDEIFMKQNNHKEEAETALNALTGYTCPGLYFGRVYKPMYSEDFEGDEKPQETDIIRHINDNYEPHCGHQYLEDAYDIYVSKEDDDTNNVLDDTDFRICLAIRSTGPVVVKFKFSYLEDNVPKTSQNIELIATATYATWEMKCVHIHQLAVAATAGATGTVQDRKLLSVWFEKDHNVRTDLDDVHIGIMSHSEVFPNRKDPVKMNDNTHRITEIKVISASRTAIVAEMYAERCASGFPTFSVVELQANTVTEISINQEPGTAPVQGLLTVNDPDSNSQQINAQATASEFHQAIESFPDIGCTKVTKTGTCNNYCFHITFNDGQTNSNFVGVSGAGLTSGTVSITQTKSNMLQYRKIPWSFLYTTHTEPQITVKAKSIPALLDMMPYGQGYIYSNNGKPTIQTIQPASITIGPTCDSNVEITFTGQNLEASSEAWVTMEASGIDLIDLKCSSASSSQSDVLCPLVKMCAPQGSYNGRLCTSTQGCSNSIIMIVRTQLTAVSQDLTGSYAGGKIVTLNGARFDSSAQVYFDDVSHQCMQVPYLSTNEKFVCFAPPRNTLPQNPSIFFTSGGYTTDAGLDFTYTQNLGPYITSISPNTATVDGETIITIDGTSLSAICGNAATVHVGSKLAEVKDCDGTQVLVKAPAFTEGLHKLLIRSPNFDVSFAAGVNLDIDYDFTITSISPGETSLLGGAFIKYAGCCFSADDKCSDIHLVSPSCEFRIVNCSQTHILAEVVKVGPKKHVCTNDGCDATNGRGYAWRCSSEHVAPGESVTFRWKYSPCNQFTTKFGKKTDIDADNDPELITNGNEDEVTLTFGTHEYCLKVLLPTPKTFCKRFDVKLRQGETCTTHVKIKGSEAVYNIVDAPLTTDPAICACPPAVQVEPEPSSGNGQTIFYPGFIFDEKPEEKIEEEPPVDLNILLALPDPLPSTLTDCAPVNDGSQITYPPGGASAYSTDVDCHFTIEVADPKEKVNIRFVSLDVEYNENCEYDYLQLFDGPDATAPVIGRYCGEAPSYQLQLQGNSRTIYAYFHSDSTIERAGFVIQYKGDESYGEISTVMNSENGWITSPGTFHTLLSESVPDMDEYNDPDSDSDDDPNSDVKPLDTSLRNEYLRRFTTCWDTDKKYCSSESERPSDPFTCTSGLDKVLYDVHYGLQEGQTFVQIQPTSGHSSVPYLPPDAISVEIQTLNAITLWVYYLYICGNSETPDGCGISKLRVLDGSDFLQKEYCETDKEPYKTSLTHIKLEIIELDAECIEFFFIYTSEGSSCGSQVPYPDATPPAPTCGTQSTTGCGTGCPGTTVITATPPTGNIDVTPYTSDEDCAWVIDTGGKELFLVFTILSLEHDPACEFDFLELHEDGVPEGLLIARLCGEAPSGYFHMRINVTSALYVRLRSNEAIEKRGFHFYWKQEAPVEAITTDEGFGYVSSPNALNCPFNDHDTDWLPQQNAEPTRSRGPFSYVTRELMEGFSAIHPNDPCLLWMPPEDACHQYDQPLTTEWVVNGETGCKFRVWAMCVTVTSEGDCIRNQLKVKDGANNDVLTLCTSVRDGEEKLTTTDTLTFTITTNDLSTYIQYAFYYENICNAALTTVPTLSSDQAGALNLTRDPAQNPKWDFTAQSGQKILFKFGIGLFKDDQDCDSTVNVYDSDCASIGTAIRTYTPASNPGPVGTSTNLACIELVVGTAYNPELYVEYKAFTETSVFTDSRNVVPSNGYPLGYHHGPSQTTQTYTIQMDGSLTNSEIAILLLDVNLECPGHTLGIKDNLNNVILAAGCWNYEKNPDSTRIAPQRLVATRLHAVITLTIPASPTDPGRGFLAVYFQQETGCGGWISPGGTTSIVGDSSARSCLYVCNTGTTSKARITIDPMAVGTYSNGCVGDYLDVYNSPPIYIDGALGNKIGQFCGNVAPDPIVGSGPTLLLIFQSSATTSTLTVKCDMEVCGATVKEDEGLVMSPGFPAPGMELTTCLYTLTPPSAPSYIVYIYEASLGTSFPCTPTPTGNKVSIHSSTPVLCGIVPPTVYVPSTAVSTATIDFDLTFESQKGAIIRYFWTPNPVSIISSIDKNILEVTITDPAAYWFDLSAQSSKVIEFNFLEFNVGTLNSDDECEGSVSFHDICIAEEIPRHCGDTLPQPVISSCRQVILYVNANAGNFKLKYKAVDNNGIISHTYTRDRGRIRSPGYPLGYPNDITYLVHTIDLPLSPSPRKSTKVFMQLSYDLASQGGTCTDTLHIEDISDGTYTLFGPNDCGEGDREILSFGATVRITFNSDSFYQKGGYSITFQAVNTRQGCGGEFTEKEVSFTSPNYPGSYPRNVGCAWKFEPSVANPSNHYTECTFSPFRVEKELDCEYDSLSIYDLTSPRNTFQASLNGYDFVETDGILCGVSNTIKFRTESTRLLFVFCTDDSTELSGFRAFCITKPKVPCSGLPVYSGNSGYITSPNYPNLYDNDQSCTYTISVTTARPLPIQIIVYAEIEENTIACPTDTITINDGVTTATTIDATGVYDVTVNDGAVSIITVTFTSDKYIRKMGFLLEFFSLVTSVPSSVRCTGSYDVGPSLLVAESPGYPGYQGNLRCNYFFEAEVGKQILLSVAYDIQPTPEGGCFKDFLMVTDGSYIAPEVPRYCGYGSCSIKSSNRVAYLKFITLSDTGRKGFRAFYIAVDGTCGGILSATSGNIMSPPNPGNLSPGFTCVWLIDQEMDWEVTIHCRKFDLGDCSNGDHVSVYTDMIYPQLRHELCGRKPPAPVRVISDYVMIKFIAGHSEESQGFECEYTIGHPSKYDVQAVFQECRGRTDALGLSECPTGYGPPLNSYPVNTYTELLLGVCTTPRVTGIDPHPINVQAGSLITITGQGFSQLACFNEVLIGTSPCHVISATPVEIICEVEVVGTLNVGCKNMLKVRVHNLGIATYDSLDVTVCVTPKLESCTPSQGSLEGGTLITLRGQGIGGYNNNARVLIDGSECEVISSDPSVLVVSVPKYAAAPDPEEYHSVTVQVPVLNPDGSIGQETIGNPDCRFILTSEKTPAVNFVYPSTIDGPTSMNILGVHFGDEEHLIYVILRNPALVEYYCRVTMVHDTYIKCALYGLPVGSFTLEVWNQRYGSASGSSLTITSTLDLSTCSPTQGSTEGGTTVTCTGNGFWEEVQETTVTLDGADAEVVSVTPTEIIFKTPPMVDLTDATIRVDVDGDTEDYPTVFQYRDSFTPNIASVTSTGANECLDTGFALTGVSFSSTDSENHISVSGRQCEVQIGATTSSLQCIVDRSLFAGRHVFHLNVDDLGYASPMTIDCNPVNPTLSTNEGTLNGGQTLTINGAGFATKSRVTICDTDAVMKWKLSDHNKLVIVTPAHSAATSCPVKIYSTAPESSTEIEYTLPVNYLYGSSQGEVTSISPYIIGTSGGDTVTITGTNIQGASSVDLGCVICSQIVYGASTTSFTCITEPNNQPPTNPSNPYPCPGTSSDAIDLDTIKISNNYGGFNIHTDVKLLCAADWSSPGTWEDGQVPKDGEVATIRPGRMVRLNMEKSPKLKNLIIEGHLLFPPDKDVELFAENIEITDCGSMEAGLQNSHERKVTITLDEKRGRLLLTDGSLILKGIPRISWTRLSIVAYPGENEITLETIVDWTPDDKIVIATTGPHDSYEETEVRKIISVDNSGSVSKIVLDRPLLFTHLANSEQVADCQESKQVNFRAEVGLLSHNIKIHGGAIHVKRTNRFELDYVEIANAGQPVKNGISSVFFDHTDHNGPSGVLEGCEQCSIKRSSIHSTFNRGIDIRGTHGVLIEDNVVHAVIGCGIAISLVNQNSNTMIYNLVTLVRKTTSLKFHDVNPGGFCISSARNIIRYNVVAGSQVHGFLFDFSEQICTVPNSCPRNEILDAFEHNLAHSCGSDGLNVINYAPQTNSMCEGSGSTPSITEFLNMTSWLCGTGATCLNCCNTRFKNFLLVSNNDAGIKFSQQLVTGVCDTSHFCNIDNTWIIGQTVSHPVETTKYGIQFLSSQGVSVCNVKLLKFDGQNRAAFGVGKSGFSRDLGCEKYTLSGVTFCNGNKFLLPANSLAMFVEGNYKFMVASPHMDTLVDDQGVSCTKNGDGSSTGGATVNDLVKETYKCDSSVNLACLKCKSKHSFGIKQGGVRLGAQWKKTTQDTSEHFQGGIAAWIHPSLAYTFRPDYGNEIIDIDCNVENLNAGEQLQLTAEVNGAPIINHAGQDMNLVEETTDFSQGIIQKSYTVGGLSNIAENFRIWSSPDSSDRPLVNLEDLRVEAQDSGLTPPDASNNDWTIDEGETFYLQNDPNQNDNKKTFKFGDVTVNGKIVAADDLNAQFQAKSITVGTDGVFLVGTEDKPFEGNLLIELKSSNNDDDSCFNLKNPNIAIFGQFELHGSDLRCNSELAADALDNQQSLNIRNDLDCKNSNGETEDIDCIITSSSYRASGTEQEKCKCVGFSSACETKNKLDEDHKVVLSGNGNNYSRPKVAILNRNIRIQPQNSGQNIGVRILVGNNGQRSGLVHMSNVEINGGGQNDPSGDGLYYPTLTFCNVNNNQLYSTIKRCVFWDNKNSAIEIQNSRDIELKENTIFEAATGIFVKHSTNVIIKGNLISDITNGNNRKNPETVTSTAGTPAGCTTACNTQSLHMVGIDLKDAGSSISLEDNTVVGSEQYGYVLNAEDTREGPSWTPQLTMNDNAVHASTIGIMIRSPTDNQQLNDLPNLPCSRLHSFTVSRSSQIGVHAKVRCSACFEDLWLFDNKLSFNPQIHGCTKNPGTCGKGQGGVPRVEVTNSVFEGTTSAYTCGQTRETPSFCSLPLDGEHNAIMCPTFLETDTTNLGTDCLATGQFPAASGSIKILRSQFINFKNTCGNNYDHIAVCNHDAPDVHHAIIMKEVTFTGVDNSAINMANFDNLNTGVTCGQDAPCEGRKMIADFGNGLTVLHRDDVQTTTFDSMIHEAYKRNIISKHGIFNIESCSLDTSTDTYHCNSPYYIYRNFLVRSLDQHANDQCLGPVSVLSNASDTVDIYTDFMSGPRGSLSTNEICVEKRPAFFHHPLRNATENRLAFRVLPPSITELSYLCAEPYQRVRVCVYYPYPQNYDVYVDEMTTASYIPPIDRTPYLHELVGSNFFNENDDHLCTIVPGGSKVIIIQRPMARMCITNLGVTCSSPEDELEAYSRTVADYAGVPASYISVEPCSSQSNTANQVCFRMSPPPNSLRLQDAMDVIEEGTSLYKNKVHCDVSLTGASGSSAFTLIPSLPLPGHPDRTTFDEVAAKFAKHEIQGNFDTGSPDPIDQVKYIFISPPPSIAEGGTLTGIEISIKGKHNNLVAVGSRDYPWLVKCKVIGDSETIIVNDIDIVLDTNTGKGTLEGVTLVNPTNDLKIQCDLTKPDLCSISGTSDPFSVGTRQFELICNKPSCFEKYEPFYINCTLYENGAPAEDVNWNSDLTWVPTCEILGNKTSKVTELGLVLDDNTARWNLNVTHTIGNFRYECQISAGGSYSALKIEKIYGCPTKTPTSTMFQIVKYYVSIGTLTKNIATRRKRGVPELPGDVGEIERREDYGDKVEIVRREDSLIQDLGISDVLGKRKRRQVAGYDETTEEEIIDQLIMYYPLASISDVVYANYTLNFSMEGQEDIMDDYLLDLFQKVKDRTLTIYVNGQKVLYQGNLYVDDVGIIEKESFKGSKVPILWIIIPIIVIILFIILVILLILLCCKYTKRDAAVSAESPEPEEEEEDLPPSVRGSRIAFAEPAGAAGGGAAGGAAGGATAAGGLTEPLRPHSSRAGSAMSTPHTPVEAEETLPAASN